MARHPSLTGDYFESLSAALSAAGIAQPTLVIDRARLDRNVDTLAGHLPEGMGYRIVAKSLPCMALIRHIRARAGTDRLMTFNLEMLLQIAREMPEAEQLLGKPLPVAAARRFYAEASADANVIWLVDTPERLAQYIDLAREISVPMAIALEVHVGLHRGGFDAGDVLKQAVETINASNHVSFSGLMGYEPHLAKMPEKGGLRQTAAESAWRIFAQAKVSSGYHEGIMRVSQRYHGRFSTPPAARPTGFTGTRASRMKFPPDRFWSNRRISTPTCSRTTCRRVSSRRRR